MSAQKFFAVFNGYDPQIIDRTAVWFERDGGELEEAVNNPNIEVFFIYGDEEHGEACEAWLFSTEARAIEWQRLLKMQPNQKELLEAPDIWRYRVGFCN